ncbi:hypothetical protein G6F56_007404 [Rhizopus delemar]|uniref:DBF4-type domain-containing protein n=1 Tax=Rhizopus stolonifer TaxID=4846 RepID=A0A367KQK1_RHIST|nr:hypothetical protein G6F56_007404 [Rhizopus delemar]RCI04427.1 hypothetical protein CU098_010268 [Rhizopus stolonifer]
MSSRHVSKPPISRETRQSKRDAELKKRLKKREETTTRITHESFITCQREFGTYRFFLYKLDHSTEMIVSRQLISLGAKQAAFFSASECTHVITTKAIQKQNINDTPESKDTNKQTDDVLKNATTWKKPIWTIEYTREIFKQLMDRTAKRHKPVYYTFPGYYLMIEDATGKHCAINIKEYSTEKSEEKKIVWPTLEAKQSKKQMFSRDVLKEIEALDEDCLFKNPKNLQTNTEDRNESGTLETIKKDKYAKDKVIEQNISTNEDTLTEEASTKGIKPINEDTSLKKDKLIQEEPIKKGKVIINYKSAKKDKQINQAKKRDKESELLSEKPKKHLAYCETCKERCPDMNIHVKTPKHLEAYKANDFTELDSLLSSLRRKYNGLLPSYMKSSVNPIVDGTDVQFDS